MRNCKKGKKWQKESYKLLAVAVRLRSTPVTLCYIVRGRVTYLLTYLLTYISSTIRCANFGPNWPLLFKVHEI